MTTQTITSEHLRVTPILGQTTVQREPSSDAVEITRAASKQTYYTVRFLVDRPLVQTAYRAYAYFRWFDDWLDCEARAQAERIAFVERQQTLVNACCRGFWLHDLAPQERLLVDLIDSDRESASGLRAYIRHMLAVMIFDAKRRGRLISEPELAEYTHHLSAAVTEALHYFIGHDDYAPQGEIRYLAAAGAHVTHMLRDTWDDIAAGYFNVPREVLQAGGINAWDIDSDAYRAWVKSRVELARADFEAGRRYLAQVESRRCRIAGYAYMARFEGVLDTIERDGYRLRPAYEERKTLRGAAKMLRSVTALMLWNPPTSTAQYSV